MKKSVFAILLLWPVILLAANLPPTISGTPPSSAVVGTFYSFTPTVKDDGQSKLSFVIKNRPSWLSFSYSTGRISGTPKVAGLYSGIQIFVDDGPNTAVASKKFSIAVISPVNGSAIVSWTPPTQNTDNTSLTNLAGYRIVYGMNPGALDKTVQIPNASLTAYALDNLGPGTYYFAVRAYTTAGLESANSNVASKVIG